MITGQQHIIETPGRILLIQLGDIGDVVLTMPCVQMLRQCYPQARLAMAVRDRGAELLADCPWLDDIFVVAGSFSGLGNKISNYLRFFKRLRHHKYELVIDLRTGTRGAVMAILSGARQRLSFFSQDGPWWRNKIFTGLLYHEYALPQHVIDYLLDLLCAFGVSGARPTAPRLFLCPKRQEQASFLLADNGLTPGKSLVAIQPFSLWAYKEWGIEKFARIIEWLLVTYDVEVIITGGPAEESRAAKLVREVGEGCYNLAGKTSIGMYAAVLAKCRLFMGVDSAGVHIGAAVGVPTVAIFGPSAAASWAPPGEEHLVITKDLQCVPCRMKGCDGSEQSRCLIDLTVAEVKEQLMVICNRFLERKT